MSAETIEDYAWLLRSDQAFEFPPVEAVRTEDGVYVWDGFHRVNAYLQAGRQEIPANIVDGTMRDATLLSAGANAANGLARTREDKRRAVEILLRDQEWQQRSSRWIASAAKVSHEFVRSVREECQRCQSSPFDEGTAEYFASDGRKLPAKRKPQSPPPEVREDPPEQEPESPPPPEHEDDTSTQVIPERLRPFFESSKLCERAEAACRHAAALMRQVEETIAYRTLDKDGRMFSTLFTVAARKARSIRPTLVCGECLGVESSVDNDPCSRCDGRGFLTASEEEG